ncbi:hypothetical protein [Cryobacterium sp. Sr8]|uniref:hypothetical protein n=1 Tax=Cryobacterium sp. Sr8 TaxID=1259203 RepID=UPI00141B43AA|nr:hypothetical protein [Cryobacterium sp. Sr8]
METERSCLRLVGDTDPRQELDDLAFLNQSATRNDAGLRQELNEQRPHQST